MKLLTMEILEALPRLGGQSEKPDPIVFAKFFTPDGSWTWYVTEGSPEGEDFMFFGYVLGFEAEWGSFALSELQSIRGRFNLPVERDRFFTPQPVSNFLKKF